MTASSLSTDLNRAQAPVAGMLARVVLLLSLLSSALASGAVRIPAAPVHTYSLSGLQAVRHDLPVPVLGRNVQIEVILPPGYSAKAKRRYASLYINDGQDAGAVALKQALQALYGENRIAPVIVVAVSAPPDRMAVYGFSDRGKRRSLPAQSRFGPVGANAHAYSDWLAGGLVPFIDSRYRTRAKPQARAILGWSLGAASAFNIGWNYPETFSRVGGFSPSFWLSTVSGDASGRLAPQLIAGKPMPKRFAVYLAAGTAEETDDRDGDGVIDVLDDAQDVIDALSSKTRQPDRRHDFRLVRLDGGRHNQATWKLLLPG
ncbi:MAG TPA: alpha/beta hydrolase-fold protein, partial [Arenimonas sp.]|nr:alpha/beta hydrolase-fold protein [Arenimonas sp.]